ncbi:MAG TPA: hypothetical protein VFA69_04825 [Candidatus Nitrosotalea sp.]|nr:hypothetical protein [Candidatus Nitrosotalea sp.]
MAGHDYTHTGDLLRNDGKMTSLHMDKVNQNVDPKKRISNEIFFACENCNGPLIQYTFCRICRRTYLRVCLKCNHVKIFGDHGSCFRVVLIDMQKNSMPGEDDV